MEFDDIRLNVSEAAKIFGISQKTIRRAIAENSFSYIVVRGRYKISFKSILEWSQKSASINKKLATKGIGQHVAQWKISNKLYSPHPKNVEQMKKRTSS
jgi:excisionase family DNA binding protein